MSKFLFSITICQRDDGLYTFIASGNDGEYLFKAVSTKDQLTDYLGNKLAAFEDQEEVINETEETEV